MSHRARQRSTHRLTARRRQQTDTDAAGEPQYSRVPVLTDEAVRFNPGGTAYVRTDSGERVQRTPTVRGRASLVEALEEGDRITLTPMDASIDDSDGAEYEIVAVNGVYGRRGRALEATIELEAK